MAKKDTTETLTTGEKVQKSTASFLEKNKKGILIGLIAVVVVLIILGIVLGVTSHNKEKEYNALVTAEENLMKMAEAGEGDENFAKMKDAVTADLTAIADGNRYANLKARYDLGLLAFSAEDWQGAYEQFISVADADKIDYLSSLALTNAAACLENLGKNEEAIELYQKVLDKFEPECAEKPRAMFALARLNLDRGDKELAKATFQQVADEYPMSEYGKLATNVLVTL